MGQLQPVGGVVDDPGHVGGGGQRRQMSRALREFEPPVSASGQELPLAGTETVLGEPGRARPRSAPMYSRLCEAGHAFRIFGRRGDREIAAHRVVDEQCPSAQ
jgi:hypothetical protein